MTAVPVQATCSIWNCDRPQHGRGWCSMHYKRWHKHGNPLTVVRPAPRQLSSQERFDLDTDKSGLPGSCWWWTGPTSDKRYGLHSVDGKSVAAHRWSYERYVGPIPDGLQLDHICRNTFCVNPDHLEPVTGRENTMRSPIAPAAVNARKTHCIHGHEFTPENTQVWQGKRQCRACKRAQENERRRVNGRTN